MALTYENIIYYCYRHSDHRVSFNSFYNEQESYDENSAFKKYVHLDISKPIFEIPCVYKYIVSNILANNSVSASATEINIPMIVGKQFPDERKSASPLLKDLFGSSLGTFLGRVKGSGIWYVGGSGIIMYDDLTPLVMFTLEVERTVVDNITRYIPKRQIMRINPVIYNNTDLMAKHIRNNMISKILPLKATSEVMHSYGWYHRALLNNSLIFTNSRLDWDFKIIIEDFSDFFISPSIPDCTFTDDKVNSFLAENEDNLVATMIL